MDDPPFEQSQVIGEVHGHTSLLHLVLEQLGISKHVVLLPCPSCGEHASVLSAGMSSKEVERLLIESASAIAANNHQNGRS